MLRKLEIEEDEEEEIYIYNAEFFYQPEDDVDQISLSDPEEEDDDTNSLYDSDPVYDTDGGEEFSEEMNFMVEGEIVEAMAEWKSFIGEDAMMEKINFVDGDKIVEEMAVVVDQQNSFQELIISRTDDYKCHKISGFHIFYEHDFFSEVLREIRIEDFIDQEGLFIFYLHVHFKVWESYTLRRPRDDYLLQVEGHYKYVTNVISNYGGCLSAIDSNFIGSNLICFDLADNDLVAYYLTNGVAGVVLFAAQKHQEKMFLDDGRISYPPKELIKGLKSEKYISYSNCLMNNMCVWKGNIHVDLGGDFGVHATFNIGDLSPYIDDDSLLELRSIPLQEGENDTNMINIDSKSDQLMLAKWDGDVASRIMAKCVCMVTWMSYLAS